MVFLISDKFHCCTDSDGIIVNAGPFLLTQLLLDYLTQTAHITKETSRVINVSCGVHDHENNFLTRSEW
jgi:hypothetical protein